MTSINLARQIFHDDVALLFSTGVVMSVGGERTWASEKEWKNDFAT